jgi:hypothetical protein
MVGTLLTQPPACLSVVTMDSWTLVLGIRPNPNDNDSLPFTLLPLQLDMFGSVAVPSSSIHTEYSTPSWKRYEDVLVKLHGLPVLRFHDAELYYKLHLQDIEGQLDLAALSGVLNNKNTNSDTTDMYQS